MRWKFESKLFQKCKNVLVYEILKFLTENSKLEFQPLKKILNTLYKVSLNGLSVLKVQ